MWNFRIGIYVLVNIVIPYLCNLWINIFVTFLLPVYKLSFAVMKTYCAGLYYIA